MIRTSPRVNHEVPQHDDSFKKFSLPLYGPLNIENSESFKEQQREIFQKCFLLRCPKKPLENFIVTFKLGEGGFGKVYLVAYKMRTKLYAMKIMKKKYLVENDYVSMTLNEKRVLQSMNFPLCVRLEFLSQDRNNLYFFLPFMYGGDMFTLLKKFKRFTEHLAKFYAGQVILALEFLHYCNLVYRDLKPENILIDHMGYIKLTDFGFTKEVKSRLYTICGTPEYMAPEVILGLGHNKAVDFWSLGVMIYETVNGETPFCSDNDMTTFNKILTVQYEKPEFFSSPLQRLIGHLLEADTTYRYGNLHNGIEDIKQHEWFEPIKWLALLNRNVIPPYKPAKTDDVMEHFPKAVYVTDSSSFDSTTTIQDQDYDKYFKDF